MWLSGAMGRCWKAEGRPGLQVKQCNGAVLLWRRALNFVNWKRWGNNEYEGHHYIL